VIAGARRVSDMGAPGIEAGRALPASSSVTPFRPMNTGIPGPRRQGRSRPVIHVPAPSCGISAASPKGQDQRKDDAGDDRRTDTHDPGVVQPPHSRTLLRRKRLGRVRPTDLLCGREPVGCLFEELHGSSCDVIDGRLVRTRDQDVRAARRPHHADAFTLEYTLI